MRKFAGPIVGFFVSVGIILTLELLANRFTESTDLDRILEILEPHPHLMWKQKSRISAELAGHSFQTDGDGFRISSNAILADPRWKVITMGGSPTFGWGVASDKTYPVRFEALLRSRGCSVNVLNAGSIGYSSHQGLSLLRMELLARKPDLITVSYVINDLDKYRFFGTDGRPDRIWEPPGPFERFVGQLARKSALVSLMQRLGSGTVKDGHAGRAASIDLFKPGSNRVPLPDYRNNLKKIVAEARSHNISVLFVVFPVNLPQKEQLTAAAQTEAEKLLEQAEELLEQQKFQHALAVLDKVTAVDRWSGTAHFLAAKAWYGLGDSEQANASLEMTMKAESHRIGLEAKMYNREMRVIAGQMDVPLVDVAEWFGTLEGALFLTAAGDPIHPNSRGHSEIAALLTSQIRSTDLICSD